MYTYMLMLRYYLWKDPPPAYPGGLDVSLKYSKTSAPINITEEVNKTTIWKQVNEGNGNSGYGRAADKKNENNKRKKQWVNIYKILYI